MTALAAGPFFFFGTLCYRPLIEAVLGDITHLRLGRADLPDHRLQSVADGAFPAITPAPGAVTSGILAEGLTSHDVVRLDYYERAFGYGRTDVVLADGQTARIYAAQEGLWQGQGDWSLDAWVADWGPLSVSAAHEVMSYIGDRPPETVAAMFPMIRARAWSRLNAKHSRHGAGTLQGAIRVEAQRRAYANFFALDEYDLRHERFDGQMTDRVTRAVFLAADAALVLPYDPVRDRVLLVEQMRMGPLARGDHACWQLEPIAGRIDPGETPAQAAHREAREEAGLQLGALHPVSETYASPGNSSEFHYCFVGLADLPETVTGTGGLAHEHEDIRSHLLSFEALIAQCDDRRIANAPLAMIAYWLARHRARLRGPS